MKQHILTSVILIASFFFATLPLHGQTFITPSFDSIPIAYEVHGEGTVAIVFVHGWSCDRSYWKEQLQDFSQHYKVVTIDLAGHGASGLGRKNYTIESFGGDVAAVVNKLGLQRVVLVGHSMGGDVIAATARLLPKAHIAGLVMVDTYKKLGPGRTPEQVRAFVETLRPHFVDSVRSLVRSLFVSSSDSSLVNWVATDMSSAPPVVALSAIESSFNYSREITKALEEIKLPGVALNSDNAPTDTASMQHYGIEIVILPGLGHFLMMEDPKRFNEALERVIINFTK
jgi:pimeloyl-ACP methyl ester carboxylesterase